MENLKLKDANLLINKAKKRALEIGQPMCIAVVDKHTNLLSFERMDEAWLGSIDIAIKKAYTSASFNISTKELAKNSQSGDQFFGIHASNNGKVMIFAGGIPIKDSSTGKTIGAIGVSGGNGEQDHYVAGEENYSVNKV